MTTLLTLAFALGAGPPVERAGVTAHAAVEPEAVALTGTTTLTLTAEGDAPLAVEPVTFAAPPGWSLVEVGGAAVEELPSNRVRWRQSFRLAPERPGELPLPPPPLRVRAAGRQSATEIGWEPIIVRVATTLADATLDEAKGVTGPLRLPDEPSSTAAWLVAAVSLLVLAAAVYVVWSRRSRRPEASPEDEARARLATLSSLDADGLTTTLRGYLVRRRGVPADRRTTAELAGSLDADWLALFQRCDLAKYAGRPFDAEEWADAVARAQSLIPASLPVGEAVPIPEAASAGKNASSLSESAAESTGE